MLLEATDLVIAYRTPAGPVRAVDGVDFAVPKGEVVGLVGESGCGKTTLARAITGVMSGNARIERGSIRFDGRELAGASRATWRELRWREISYIPQSAMNSLDPVYRVGDQLLEVLERRGGLSRAKGRARAEELFDLVGIEGKRLRDYPHEFSGGMRQRAAIAMALALEPKLVIADEPVTALDVIVQRQILDTLNDLQKRLGISVLLVTHDISVVAYVCDRVAVMYAGKIAEFGPVRTVLSAPVHPYSMGLMNAFPDLGRAARTLVPIEGAPPDLHEPPAGCRFAPRCPFRVDACAEPPTLQRLDDVHAAACWRSGEAETLRRQAEEVTTWQR